jgi:prophage regulatory protein
MRPDRMTKLISTHARRASCIREGSHMHNMPKGGQERRRSPAAPDPHTDPVFLNMRQLRARLGLGEMSIRRLVEQGRFPRPVRLSPQRVGWRVADVMAWEASRSEVA